MAEHVVEDVRLLEIVELRALADEVAGREAAVAEMLEEDVVGDEPRHRHHRPAGAAEQPLVQLAELGHAGMAEAQDLEALLERVHGAAGERLLLAREQQVPDRMLLGAERLPILGHGPVGGGAGRRPGRVLRRAMPFRRRTGGGRNQIFYIGKHRELSKTKNPAGRSRRGINPCVFLTRARSVPPGRYRNTNRRWRRRKPRRRSGGRKREASALPQL